jgi:hypothetical protein
MLSHMHKAAAHHCTSTAAPSTCMSSRQVVPPVVSVTSAHTIWCVILCAPDPPALVPHCPVTLSSSPHHHSPPSLPPPAPPPPPPTPTHIRHVPGFSWSHVGAAQPVCCCWTRQPVEAGGGTGPGLAAAVAGSGTRDTSQVRVHKELNLLQGGVQPSATWSKQARQ